MSSSSPPEGADWLLGRKLARLSRQAAEIAAFVGRHKRWPRKAGRRVPEQELKAGRNLGRFRARAGMGPVSEEAPLPELGRAILDAVIPGWDAPTIHTRIHPGRPRMSVEHCIEPGCTEPAVARDRCNSHYGQWQKNHPDEVTRLRRWTAEEDELLASGLPMQEVADRIGRTYDACALRRKRLKRQGKL